MDGQISGPGERSTSELRIVLLGYEESGKSSAGNTILGSDAFDLQKHAECVKKEGLVAGRPISVIDTPGRHKDYAATDTPKLYQQEVLRSATLCPPGPHALLLVVNVQIQFAKEIKVAVTKHLNLFGETVWNHIIVLFTHVDQLTNNSNIERHIELEGQPLKELLKKCGNRYHVFNNNAKDGSTQVAELLKKIDEMVAGNYGSHFELDKEKLSFLAQKRREYEESKMIEKQQCKETVRLGNELKLTELRLVLLGRESAGKTSTADTILNSEESEVKTTLESTSRDATVGRWCVTVVDTPGWVMNVRQNQTPRSIKLEIVRSVSLCPPGPHAFLLVIPANKTFTKANEMAIKEHLELIGEKVWNHTIVLFTHADWMGDTPIELYVKNEGKPLNRILEKCGNRYHVLCNMYEHGQNQVETLLEKIEVLVAGNRNCFYEMDKKRQQEMADEGENGDTGTIYQLPPSDDTKEVLGQRVRTHKSGPTLGESSGYGSAVLSECGTIRSKGQPPELHNE